MYVVPLYLTVRCLKLTGAVATPSQAASSQPPASTPASTAPVLGFGDKFKKPEGSWECDVCSVQNKAEDQQCVACQSAKPGAKVETKGSENHCNATDVFFCFFFVCYYLFIFNYIVSWFLFLFFLRLSDKLDCKHQPASVQEREKPHL